MKYLAAGPWLKTGEASAKRTVLYKSGEGFGSGEFVVHTQIFEGGKVAYDNGDYFNSHKPIRKATRRWLARVTQQLDAGYEPAPVELAEAAELAALAARMEPVTV